MGQVNIRGARKFVPIVNDVALQPGCVGVYVGAAGSVVVIDRDGNTVTFLAVPVGSVLPISPAVVTAASVATGLIALYD